MPHPTHPLASRRRFGLALAAITLSPAVTALAGPLFSIPWHTLDGGGGRSVGGAFELTGTIGQFDAAPTPMTGGTFALTGGFWVSVPVPCPADFNADGIVNTADITAFLSAWFADRADGTLTADFDASGTVNTADITAFLSAWFAARAGGC